MSKLGSVKITRRITPTGAIRKLNKTIWTREFKEKYAESVRYYVKPSEKKAKNRKRAIYADIRRKHKQC